MHYPITNTGRARRATGILAGALALLITASCASEKDTAAYPCPVVAPVRELGYMTKFQGDSQDLSDTLFEAKVDEILPAANCVYQEDDSGKRAIVYDIRVKFLAQRGPKDREGAAKFNYFMAITGPAGQPLTRQVFDTEIPFENNATQAITVEELQPRIPLKQGENGDYYRIYVGFALNEKELAYNRK
ncbi:MAG TPA: hypothetical protein VFE34_22200, partial [Dongiaceae bacterium]|nr:hypothetical protein [Dongiaceae bacterium]